MIDTNHLRLSKIFLPYATTKMEVARAQNTRLVYYTTAATAARIIESKEIWMRNAATMNDFLEVQYGWRCLRDTYNAAPGRRLQALLRPHFPKLFPELERRFTGWTPHFLQDTFILCVSEHLASEDYIGRLSMWRAYGAGSGVALVLRSPAFLSETDALRAYSSPVAYLHGEGFAKEFTRVVDGIERELDFIKQQEEESVLGWLFSMMRFAVISTKHQGFEEEKEWRVVHSPRFEPSKRLICSVETIGGTPQRVYKIPLRNVPEENFIGAEIPELLERVIIGPTKFPSAIADAFKLLLTDAGVADPDNRIAISNIPLRPS